MRKAEKKHRGRGRLEAGRVRNEPGASPFAVAPSKATTPVEPPPDPEVAERATRRSFTAEFKRQVLAEADACIEPGQSGALLRRHGLYSSHRTSWRLQREQGALAGLSPRKRGRKAGAKNPLAETVVRLERALERTTRRAERAERLLELQKKVAELLGETLPAEEELLEADRRGLPIPPATRRRL